MLPIEETIRLREQNATTTNNLEPIPAPHEITILFIERAPSEEPTVRAPEPRTPSPIPRGFILDPTKIRPIIIPPTEEADPTETEAAPPVDNTARNVNMYFRHTELGEIRNPKQSA